MQVIIDEYAGFCPGVIRAVKNAEKILEEKGELYCLGDLVHNDEEIKRLERKGLVTIKQDDIAGLPGKDLMFRAHGEPPSSYDMTAKSEAILNDNTCAIVRRLQKKIKKEFEEPSQKNVVIFGKRNHPEVIGLAGQTGNSAIIIENEKDISDIDFSMPVVLFSQTTMNEETFKKISKQIGERAQLKGVNFKAYNTICKQVSNRVEKIREFARKYDLILFVSGEKSSNGRYLFTIVCEENTNSRKIKSADDLELSWFKGIKSVGISGATSTPPWLLEHVADYIKKL